jgi:hypothetical protein
MLDMDIGNSVYLVTDHKTTGAGVPAVICGLYNRSARIAIEREEGTKTFDVPLWDLLPARACTAAILRVCYGVWESLDQQGRSPGTLREAALVRELARAGLAEKTAEMCARLSWDVDWSAKSPLSAWLKAIRSFYLPKLPSV